MLVSGAGHATHRLGVAVTAVASEAGRVAVGFSDGSSGGYDLVVGADGIYSTVRALTVSPVPPQYAPNGSSSKARSPRGLGPAARPARRRPAGTRRRDAPRPLPAAHRGPLTA
jgi:2-polyprenyl-6-methoxyphenol hydroxylase-like FAD-dependent oxidoreductase